MDVFRITIAAFDKSGVGRNLQPHAWMTAGNVTAVAGDFVGVNNYGFGGLDGHRGFLLSVAEWQAMNYLANMSEAASRSKSAMTSNAIEISGLRKIYRGSKGEPEKEALKGIDLNIPQGSVFGLLGPNGAGKSTLINILAGLVLKSEGKVKIWGFDQDENPRMSRASIGVMPQELNLDPFFTPRGALEVQAGLYGVAAKDRDSDGILKMIGLEDKAEAYARTLSGGMRRRLLLGKALVHHPHILVLDEPTAGVDIELRQMLWENVRKLNRQGMTIILTTHYLEEAEEMCDEIAIINHGEVVARDTTANLLGSLDAKTMVIQPSVPPETLPDAAGITVEKRAGGAIALGYNSKTTTAEQVLQAVHAAGISISDVKTEQADLEDVFLDLTRSR